MVKSKDFVFNSYDVEVVTDVISHLSSMLAFGVTAKTHNQHNFWASYYSMATSSFKRMCDNLIARCDIELDNGEKSV